jgi:hypothetical protein
MSCDGNLSVALRRVSHGSNSRTSVCVLLPLGKFLPGGEIDHLPAIPTPLSGVGGPSKEKQIRSDDS